MTPERYARIEREEEKLTPEEIAAGWHFCSDWDYELVGPGTLEMTVCTCFSKE
jgi:hypothetical protein